jgi:hypothetical protein
MTVDQRQYEYKLVNTDDALTTSYGFDQSIGIQKYYTMNMYTQAIREALVCGLNMYTQLRRKLCKIRVVRILQ